MNTIKILIMLAVLALTGSCGRKSASEQEATSPASETSVTLTDAQLKNAGIEIGNIQEDSIAETLQLTGMVDVPPQNIVSVSFPLGGYLKSTSLLPGMHVSRGQSIGVIEDPALIQLQQDYLLSKSRLELTKLDFERQKTLNETRTAADKVLQQAQADYESAKITNLALAEKLRLIHLDPDRISSGTISRMVAIPSPINGFVSRVNVNIGKYVQPQDVLFELINPDDIHATLTVFEKDITKLKEGQPVAVSFVDDPGKTYPAEVLLITKNVDENRSGLVHCHFEKIPDNLRPGMFINALVTLNASKANVVPEAAVVRFNNREYVFEKRAANQFEAVPVTVGRRSNGRVEIQVTNSEPLSRPIIIKNAFAALSALKNVGEDE